jgi:predicted PurR-regulated permease PerM
VSREGSLVAVASHSLKDFAPKSFASSVIGMGVVIALLYYGRMFLVTVATAIVLAFILEPFVLALMRIRCPRALASFLVCAVGICVVYLAGLGVYTQAEGLFEDLPKYSQRISDISGQVLSRAESIEGSLREALVPKQLREQAPPAPQQPAKSAAGSRRKRQAEPVLPPAPVPAPDTVTEVRIRPERPPLVDFVYTHLGSVYEIVLMASFVPFLVYFMLSWQDHLRRAFLQLFHGEDRIVASKTLTGIAGIVRAYVAGNFLLGLLLALLSTAAFWLMSWPFALLVGPLSGFLSLVPYIGLPLAVLPPLLSGLTVYTALAPYLAVLGLVALFHMIAMNLLYPKIVGPRVHLNPLMITIALMFWSVLWGAAGLVLAIPLTAGIKAVCDNVAGLQPYGKLLGD